MRNSASSERAPKVAVFSTTRADWGLLRPLCGELLARGCLVRILASNMHLDPKFGNTVSEIRDDGFDDIVAIPLGEHGDTPLGKVEALAAATAGFGAALADFLPDMAVALGDRFEMLGAATAAATLGIPLAHIAGGEVTAGALDERYRHAITKLADIHFTATEQYRANVVQMGEDPRTVFHSGALGVENIHRLKPLSLGELEESLDFALEGSDFAIVTYHPVTAVAGADASDDTYALCRALDRYPDLKLIVTYPNNDAGGEKAIGIWEEYAAGRPGRVCLVPSLGARRYLSALRYAALVVGNSSSGIVEVPSAHIPTVNIGPRQSGRIASESVLNCRPDADSISAAISRALSVSFRRFARRATNPYDGGKSPSEFIATKIVEYIQSPSPLPKRFHSIR